jgi:hypothetical protein
MEGLAGLTVTEATGTAITLICVVPLFPSLVAVIVIGPPTVTAVTSPLEETLAMSALLDVHATARPESADPLISRVATASCAVDPTVIVGAGEVTTTEATEGGGGGGPDTSPPLQDRLPIRDAASKQRENVLPRVD